MYTDDLGRDKFRNGPSEDHDRKRMLELLIRRLPTHMQTVVGWLRQPSVRVYSRARLG